MNINEIGAGFVIGFLVLAIAIGWLLRAVILAAIEKPRGAKIFLQLMLITYGVVFGSLCVHTWSNNGRYEMVEYEWGNASSENKKSYAIMDTTNGKIVRFF